MKEDTLQSFIGEMSQCLINPVKVSQLLFCERCISKEILVKKVSLQGFPDEKKTTLLFAIYTTISLDCKNLKVLPPSLSKFEDTIFYLKKLSMNVVSNLLTTNLLYDCYFFLSSKVSRGSDDSSTRDSK